MDYKGIVILENIKLVKNIKCYNQEVRKEFRETMANLLRHEKFNKLAGIAHHLKCTRLKHSVDVGYFSFYIAKLLGLDYASAGKAALLHDLCFHHRAGFKHNMKMLRQHPKDALKNALDICVLSEKERDIIAKHMWLVATLRPPKSAEGVVVTLVDKYCASKEFIGSIVKRNKYALKSARF